MALEYYFKSVFISIILALRFLYYRENLSIYLKIRLVLFCL